VSGSGRQKGIPVGGWPRHWGWLSPRERLRTSVGAALGAVAGARGAVLSHGGPAPAPFTLDTAGEAPPAGGELNSERGRRLTYLLLCCSAIFVELRWSLIVNTIFSFS
jgi:hypothetical protein